MNSPSSDPSIHEEPHLREGGFHGDPSEAEAARTLGRSAKAENSGTDAVQHSVWDEPAISTELAGPVPEGAATYAAWIDKGRRETSAAKSWTVTACVALLAGPWAIAGAFLGRPEGAFGVLAMVVFGPMVEEVMKTAAPLLVVERRPFLFRSPAQLAVCALLGALVFACIENVLYLKVYVKEPSAAFVWWRWTVCVGLHVGCTAIATMGLLRVWRDLWQRHARPRLHLSFPYVVTAVVIHGVYNVGALVISRVYFRP